MPTVNFTDRMSMEAVFGVKNIKDWANIDIRVNDLEEPDDTSVVARIEYFIQLASSRIYGLLMAGPHKKNLASWITEGADLSSLPFQIRHTTALYAGIQMHDMRGTSYSSEEQGQTLKVYREQANALLSDIRTGVMQLPEWDTTEKYVPSIVETSDTPEAQLLVQHSKRALGGPFFRNDTFNGN